ncbi:MAG: lipopolysaccharide biosynthesis protein, partial [Peristeroidobacter soli]
MKSPEPEATSLADLIEIVRRRARAIVTVFAIAMLATCVLALAWPPTFRSTGTILIEQQEIPTDLVRSTVTSYADERVQVISQRVMTTQNLLEIIRRYGLYQNLQKRESRENIIERMRRDIQFRMISADVVDPRTGVPRRATIAFTVSYDNPSPDLAVKVANEITSLYLNENLSSRSRLAEDASSFLTTEGDRLSTHIAELESKLAVFKEKNISQLPELVQLNMQLLDRTEQQLRDAVTEQRSYAQQRVYLEAQLAQLKPNSVMFSDSGDRILTPTDRLRSLRSELASSRALYAENHPDIARLEREISGLEAQGAADADTNDLLRQLDEARADLGATREKYSAEHPDVKNAERRVAALEAELAKPRNTAKSRQADAPDNPAYI